MKCIIKIIENEANILQKTALQSMPQVASISVPTWHHLGRVLAGFDGFEGTKKKLIFSCRFSYGWCGEKGGEFYGRGNFVFGPRRIQEGGNCLMAVGKTNSHSLATLA